MDDTIIGHSLAGIRQMPLPERPNRAAKPPPRRLGAGRAREQLRDREQVQDQRHGQLGLRRLAGVGHWRRDW